MTAVVAPETALAHEYARLHPGEVANELENGPAEEFVAFLSGASSDIAGLVFQNATPSAASRLLEHLPAPAAAALLVDLDPARGAALLAEVDPEVASATLGALPVGVAREIRELMLYPPETAGGLMSARVETFRPDATAGEILDDLRTRPGGQVLDVVLVDPSAQVVGLVAIEDLATAGSSTPASDLVRRSPPSVDAMASRDEVLETLDQSKARTLPVVDAAGRLLGVLRQDALVRAVEAEFSVDMQTMVGASKEEQALSPVMFAVRKRLPWLQINLVTAFLAAAVVGLFEETIAQVTALAVLLPVVAGQSGNTGAQALAVTMRGLALREIRLRHWRQVSIKEATVGFLNGIGVSLTTSIGVYVWSRSATLSLVIGSSMLLSMVTAGLAGAVVPLMLTALRQDPAGSSSIVLTTVTDIVGFFSFLGIATLLMSSL